MQFINFTIEPRLNSRTNSKTQSKVYLARLCYMAHIQFIWLLLYTYSAPISWTIYKGYTQNDIKIDEIQEQINKILRARKANRLSQFGASADANHEIHEKWKPSCFLWYSMKKKKLVKNWHPAHRCILTEIKFNANPLINNKIHLDLYTRTRSCLAFCICIPIVGVQIQRKSVGANNFF